LDRERLSDTISRKGETVSIPADAWRRHRKKNEGHPGLPKVQFGGKEGSPEWKESLQFYGQRDQGI
jgi:hypothetical protein